MAGLTRLRQSEHRSVLKYMRSGAPSNAVKAVSSKREKAKNLSGDNRAVEPPESIPNSVVKRSIADGSVGSPHVRVGHRQAPNWFYFFDKKVKQKELER